jgi:regulatory helix-turn-helix LysR family protein
MQLDELNVLAAFLTIAEERSFTKAAKRLGIWRSALGDVESVLDQVVGHGIHLGDPSRRQQPAALSALIENLRL